MTNVGAAGVALSAGEVTRAPAEPLSPTASGVENTILSEHEGTYAGVLRIPAGVSLPRHEHRAMAHHVWVVDGAVFAVGRTLERGSYWFVPHGREHAVEGLPPDGCTLFYVDVPER